MITIRGKKDLSGTVKIGGSKNAALPVIAASLLISGKTVLQNVPRIGDVFTFLEILDSLGVQVHFEKNRLSLDATVLKNSGFDTEKMKKIRVSLLLIAPLLERLGSIAIPTPGGCKLGKRPIDAHLKWLEKTGYNYQYDGENILLSGQKKSGNIDLNAGFWVTATENLLVANVLRPGKTTIYMAAIEPHVMNLIDFLRSAGANISIRYDNTIIIEGVETLQEVKDFSIVSDYIQSGTYIIIAVLSAKEYLDIENARIVDLYSFLEKIREAGVRIEERGGDVLRVYRTEKISPVSLQTNIFPGFPTDLQSPFGVLMTQAEGVSHIHEVLFEGRLSFLFELEKMWVQTEIINSHEARIHGRAGLLGGQTVTSWDLRAGAAMVIAGLITEGETTITKVEYIHRGYEDFVAVLTGLGADISEIK